MAIVPDLSKVKTSSAKTWPKDDKKCQNHRNSW